MKGCLKVVLALGMFSCFTPGSPITPCAASTLTETRHLAASQPVKAMREYKGVKLGMKQDDVRAAMGKVENTSETSDDFKLTGEDTMTVHYDNGLVKAIQLAFLDPKNAPAWADVVGDAEVNETSNGAKIARKTVPEEHFWVSIYQSKDGTITRITISK